MWKTLGDYNKQQAKVVWLSFIVTTAVGKLARELAKLLFGSRLIADAQVVLSPQYIKGTLGSEFTRWVCTLEEPPWLFMLI